MNDAHAPRRSLSGWFSVVAVTVLGLSAGAMLTEAALLVPYWRALAADDFLRWFRENEWRLVAFFGPLEIAGAVLTLIAAGIAAVERRRASRLLSLATLLAVGVLVIYPLYFQDVNASFVAGTIATATVADELARWSSWQWVRVAMGGGAFVAATLALRLTDS